MRGLFACRRRVAHLRQGVEDWHSLPFGRAEPCQRQNGERDAYRERQCDGNGDGRGFTVNLTIPRHCTARQRHSCATPSAWLLRATRAHASTVVARQGAQWHDPEAGYMYLLKHVESEAGRCTEADRGHGIVPPCSSQTISKRRRTVGHVAKDLGLPWRISGC